MNLSVNIYDAKTIDTLHLSNSEVATLARKFWFPLMEAGASTFINNVNSQLLALTIDDLVLPVTVNDLELENSYVCSPYAHYITYAKEELVTLKNPLLEGLLKQLINLLGIFLSFSEINRVVSVNNWMLSTNLYPDLSFEQVTAITSFLQKRFPKHAIIFRSINTYINSDLYSVFQKNGYQAIASRQVYLLNPKYQSSMSNKMRWHLKNDIKLFEKQGYEVIDSSQISSADIPRVVELYNVLYLEKYPENNPQFNEQFVELALTTNFLQIKALRKAGRIDGIIGFYEINGVMTTPLFGYDTSLPQEIGLYRMLAAQLVIEGTQRGIILNQSSGAASFKRRRGFIGNIEYTAVCDRHLPLRRKLGWRLLGLLVNKIAVPLLKRYKL